MEKKPLVKSAERLRGNKYINDDPIVEQPKSGYSHSPDVELISDPRIGGEHREFDDSEIAADVIRLADDGIRQSFVRNVSTALARDNTSDPRTRMAAEGLWPGRKINSERQSATPRAVSDSDDVRAIRRGRSGNWGGR